MPAGENGPEAPLVDGRLPHRSVRVVVVNSPDAAAPLVAALAAADVGAWMWTADDHTLFFSPRVLTLLGLAAEPAHNLLSRFFAGVSADDRPQVRHVMGGESPTGPYTLRYRFTPSEGPLRWIEDRGHVERDSSGRLRRQAGVLRDITREVGQEHERLEATARLEALVNAMPFSVWGRSGADLRISHQNAHSRALWGDMRGKTLDEAPADVREHWRALAAALMTGEVLRERGELTRDGEQLVFKRIVAPVIVEDRVAGMVGVAIDITAEERAEQQQRALERRVHEHNKLDSLGVMAGGIAHSFNNLLTTILGNASLLRAEEQPQATADSLDQIETAALRAAELCRQMLALAGRGRFVLAPLAVNEVVSGTAALTGASLGTPERITLSLARDLPLVLTDEAHLRQALTALLMNAAEAVSRGPGGISIVTARVSLTAADAAAARFGQHVRDGDYVSVKVTDEGDGMSGETMSRIFDPFFSTKFTGRGLGLASVLGIVRAHGGALRVQSKPGHGSAFELLLPVREETGVLPANSAVTESAHYHVDHGTLWGTALVIDDEASVRELVRTILERAGMSVRVAADGASGVATFADSGHQTDIVLVDLTMPGLSGADVLHRLRELQPSLRAVVMSGYTADSRELPAGTGFLEKPFTPAVLRAAVREALRA